MVTPAISGIRNVDALQVRLHCLLLPACFRTLQPYQLPGLAAVALEAATLQSVAVQCMVQGLLDYPE